MHARSMNPAVITAAAFTLGMIATELSGAVVTWDGGGGDNKWSTAVNWVGDVAPIANDSPVFAGAVVSNSNDYVANTQFNGITFAAGASGFTLAGNAINLNGSVVNLSSNTQTLGALPVNLVANTTFNASAASLSVSGGIGGGFGLTKIGGNTLTLGTVLSTYTGETKIQQGTLTLAFSGTAGTSNNLISSSSALEFGGLSSSVPTSLTATSKNSTNNSQTFNGTTVKAGRHTLTLARGNGSGSMSVNLGAIIRESTGLLHIASGTNGTLGTTVHVDASGTLTNGILGGWATYGSNWATLSGADMVAYSAYTIPSGTAPVISNASATNVQITNTNAMILSGVANTSGTAIITMADTAGLNVGDVLTGTGVPLDATITSVDSATQITISANTSAAVTAFSAYAPVTMASGGVTDINTLQITDGNSRIINIGSGNTLRLGQYGGIWRTAASNSRTQILGGTITAGGADNTAGELVFRIDGNVNNTATNSQLINIVTSEITDNGTGVVSVIKTGVSGISFAAGNAYSGDTFIHQGTLRSDGAGGFGTGDVYVADGAQAWANGNSTYTNDIFAQGSGPSVLNGAGLNSSFGGIRLGATTTIASSATITATGNLSISNGTNASTAIIAAKITGNYNLAFNGSGYIGSNIRLSNSANDWTGNTTVVATGSSSGTTAILHLGASEVIPDGTGKGNLYLSVPGTVPSVTFHLQGYSETVNGLNSSGGSLLDSKRQILNTNTSSASTLTVGNNDADGIFYGQINASGSAILHLTKMGTGTQVLSGSNSYAGATTIQDGILQLLHNNGTGSNGVARGSLTGTSGITVESGGRLMLAGDAAVNTRIRNAADVILAGGTFDLNGLSEGAADSSGVGKLTVSASSVIDFGAGSSSVIQFADFAQTDGAILTINNWDGIPEDGNGTERLLFAGDATVMANFISTFAQNEIVFTDQDSGYTVVSFGTYFEVIAGVVPEPASLSLLALSAAGLLRRRR